MDDQSASRKVGLQTLFPAHTVNKIFTLTFLVLVKSATAGVSADKVMFPSSRATWCVLCANSSTLPSSPTLAAADTPTTHPDWAGRGSSW